MTAQKKSKEEILSGMDDAASEVAPKIEELREKYPEAIREIAELWEDNYRRAGHKRLAYLLMGRDI